LGKLPCNWGAGSQTDGSTRGHSWLTYLLPNLEEGPLYDRVRLCAPVGDVDNQRVAVRKVQAFICPSDPSEGIMTGQSISSTGKLAKTNYKSVAGANWKSGKFKHRKKDIGLRGRYASSYDGMDQGDGPICRGYGGQNGSATLTSMGDLRDGVSHTFIAGEAVPDWCKWSAWYWWDGSTATCAIPLNYRPEGKTREENGQDKMNCYSFMSNHPGGGNFVYGDGHVKFIRDEIKLEIYRAAATIDGKEIVDEEE